MRAEKIHISNFRSLRDVEVGLDGLTILIGANGSGKTSVLEALRMFGDDHTELSKDDFFPGTDTMEISVTMDPEGDAGVPQEYLIGGKVTVKKVAELEDGGRVVELLRVEKMCMGGLVGVRDKRTGRERQAEMRRLSAEYPGLRPTDAWPDNLNSYEHDRLNDADCQDRYVRHFIDIDQSEFGAGGLLDIMYVPAVRNIEADAMDDGNSLLSELIDTEIRGTGKYDARLEKIIDTANRKAKRLMRTVDREGGRLAKEIRERALLYADNAGFELEFVVPGLKNARPRATLTFKEDGLPIPMDRAGSGLQRVYLMALLETIHSIGEEGDDGKGEEGDDGKGEEGDDGKGEEGDDGKGEEGDDGKGEEGDDGKGEEGDDGKGEEGDDGKAKIILIDEPELYQHPQRQGRMLRALGSLAKKSAVQVVCSTHSPYFVWLEEIGRVRRLQKEGRETVLKQTSVERIAKSVNAMKIRSRPVDRARMVALLDLVSSRWITEGLFARLVVLVEGPGDRSMLLATARAMNISLDVCEVSIVPCEGKPNMPYVLQVFRHLGVPAYPVWDMDPKSDDKHNSRLNRGLQRLADPGATGAKGAKRPVFGRRHSCVTPNLPDATIAAIKDSGRLLEELMRHYGLNPNKDRERKGAMQNQRIVYDMLMEAGKDRRRFNYLPTVKILRRVVSMRRGLRGMGAAGCREAKPAGEAAREPAQEKAAPRATSSSPARPARKPLQRL